MSYMDTEKKRKCIRALNIIGKGLIGYLIFVFSIGIFSFMRMIIGQRMELEREGLSIPLWKGVVGLIIWMLPAIIILIGIPLLIALITLSIKKHLEKKK